MKKICKKRSFTLIEMLIAMSLLSMVLYSLVLLLDQTEKAMTNGVAKMKVLEDARLVLDRIQNDIQNIDSVSFHSMFGNNELAIQGDGSMIEIYTTRLLNSTPNLCKVQYSLSGHALQESVTFYDCQELDEGSTPQVLSGGYTGKILLNNVLYFNISRQQRRPDDAPAGDGTKNDPNLLGYMLFIHLQLADQKTVTFAANSGGSVQATREKVKAGDFDSGKILKRFYNRQEIMDQAMQHFSRIIFIDKSSI